MQHVRVPQRLPEDNPANHPGERAEHVAAAAGADQEAGAAAAVRVDQAEQRGGALQQSGTGPHNPDTPTQQEETDW